MPIHLQHQSNTDELVGEGKRHFAGNAIPLVRFALKLIGHSDFIFTKTDKDGGFAGAQTDGLAVERRRILDGP